MDYQIVATLGPGSQARATWEKMLSCGVTAFRLNTSHLSHQQLKTWMDDLVSFFSSFDASPWLVLDLQGSKWRLGQFAAFELIEGHAIELIYTAKTDHPYTLPVPHEDFFKAAPLSSQELVLNDAKVRLKLESAGSSAIKARVVLGGPISANKGITYQSSEYRQEALSEKDQAILEETHGLSFIRYAISYVKDAQEMRKYRELAGASTYLIAKLERDSALAAAGEIAECSNELWLCRGDLGAELGISEMAKQVHRFSDAVVNFQVPVLLAGQVLEHLTGQPAPTRSEVCGLYDALAMGYRGFVLSDETAIGSYPIEACQAAALFKS